MTQQDIRLLPTLDARFDELVQVLRSRSNRSPQADRRYLPSAHQGIGKTSTDLQYLRYVIGIGQFRFRRHFSPPLCQLFWIEARLNTPPLLLHQQSTRRQWLMPMQNGSGVGVGVGVSIGGQSCPSPQSPQLSRSGVGVSG